MTRFKGIKILGKKPNEIFIKDKEKDYYIHTEDEVVDLLNELAEEKEKLKKQFKRYEDGLWVRFTRLEKENEQLKEEIRSYPINEQYAEEIMQQNQELCIERNDLRRKNEKLREFIELMNMRQKWKLYNYKGDNDE